MLNTKNQQFESVIEMNMPLSSENDVKVKRFARIKQHLYSDLNGEAVILSLRNGKYYGLNSVGACIWNGLAAPVTLSELESAVMNEYDVDEAVCEHEVDAFLRRMVDEGLVEILDEPNP